MTDPQGRNVRPESTMYHLKDKFEAVRSNLYSITSPLTVYYAVYIQIVLCHYYCVWLMHYTRRTIYSVLFSKNSKNVVCYDSKLLVFNLLLYSAVKFSEL